jgi:gas vesicle protein
MSDNRTTDTLVAFLFGAVVGAGVALLMAPQSGEETRRRLGETARKVSDDVQGKIDTTKDELRHRAGDVRTALQAGKDAYQKARSEEPAPTSSAM